MKPKAFWTEARILGLIILVAVLARTGTALYLGDTLTSGQQVRAFDQITYNLLSQSILEGRGYTFKFDYYPGFTPAGQPTAHWSFLYPLYLSGVYSLTGFHPIAARLLQVILVGILETWLVYRLGRSLFNVRVGLVSAGLSAMYAYFIFYDATLMTEPFFISMVLAMVLISLHISGMAKDTHPKAKTYSAWIMLGFTLGFAALLRQTILLWLPFQFLWLSWASRLNQIPWKRILVGSTLVLLIIIIMIVPWTIRNYQVYHSFLPLNSNAGYAIYSANHPDHGTHFDQDYAAPLPEDLLQLNLNEAQWNNALTMRGVEFAFQDPGRYLALTLSKLAVHFNFWFSKESSLFSNLMRVFSFGLYLPFFIIGLILSIKNDWRRCSIIYLFAIIFNLLHILTWSGVRYRLPMDALMMPFAGFAIYSIYEWIKHKSARKPHS